MVRRGKSDGSDTNRLLADIIAPSMKRRKNGRCLWNVYSLIYLFIYLFPRCKYILTESHPVSQVWSNRRDRLTSVTTSASQHRVAMTPHDAVYTTTHGAVRLCRPPIYTAMLYGATRVEGRFTWRRLYSVHVIPWWSSTIKCLCWVNSLVDPRRTVNLTRHRSRYINYNCSFLFNIRLLFILNADKCLLSSPTIRKFIHIPRSVLTLFPRDTLALGMRCPTTT